MSSLYRFEVMIFSSVSERITRLFAYHDFISGEINAANTVPTRGVGKSVVLPDQVFGTRKVIDAFSKTTVLSSTCTDSSCVPGREQEAKRMGRRIKRKKRTIKKLMQSEKKAQYW